MKKLYFYCKPFLLCIFCLLMISACTANTDFDMQWDVPDAYIAILNDYDSVIEYRLDNTFESKYNNGITIEINDALANSIQSDTLGNWSNMLVEMTNGLASPSKSDFGYIVYDLNDDQTPELIWVRSDHEILAIFTLVNNQARLLDAFWSRHTAVLNNNGELIIRSSAGADFSDYMLCEIAVDGEMTCNIIFGTSGNTYYKIIDGSKVLITEDDFYEFIASHPAENGIEWMSIKISSSGQGTEVCPD